jgi:hypothetical protein
MSGKYFKPTSDKPNLWTIMIYMAGDNDLDNFGISDLREIKRVGSSDHVQVIAELDRSGPEHLTKRYWLKDTAAGPALKHNILEQFEETDSGSPEQLRDFIKWGLEEFPAEHYFVILWSHGAGAYDEDIYYSTETRLRPRISRRGLFRSFAPVKHLVDIPPDNHSLLDNLLDSMRFIAPDDDARTFIDNVELKTALQEVGRKIEVLGMDACLMSMIEVCYQLRDCADIIVSSEAQEPMEGWPYEALVRELIKNPKMTPPEIATVAVDEFVKLYEDYENSSTTLAACDTSRCVQLVEPLSNLVDCFLANIDDSEVTDAIMLTRYIVQADDFIESVDLYDFCNLLMKKSRNKGIVECCDRFIQTFHESGAIIKRQPLVGGAEHWHGLSIYFPTVEVSQQYNNLDLVQGSLTNWKKFIDRYVDMSGR